MPCWSCSQAHPGNHQLHQPKEPWAQGQVGTWNRNSKGQHPACIPPRAGPAQPQPQAWNSPRWVSSAFGTQICCRLGHGTTYREQGKGITQDLYGQPNNISTMGFFWVFGFFSFSLISFNCWALDKMHEENNNEKHGEKNTILLLLIPSHCKCPSTLVFGPFLMPTFLAKKCFVPAPGWGDLC